jgi:zinc transporter, ZIP family
MLTSTGATIEHPIDVAVETPEADTSFYGLMGLLGTYVGIIPVVLGMLFFPALRRISDDWVRLFMAVTIGLLGFLVIDGSLEGLEIGGGSAGAFGGPELLFLGAGAAYLALTAIDRQLRAGVERRRRAGTGGFRLSLMVAIGIGLHNLGEGLAIGSAYAVGSLALGAFLVIGFAIHNTTEGLAIVAPLARADRPSLPRLLALGLIAGGPAVLGAVIGAAAYNPELATFLIGVGVGAIVQVIGQLLPSVRDRDGQALHPLSIAGILVGVGILYATSLLVSV